MKTYFFLFNLMVMWSFFGCGKKKAVANEADVWLEKNFPAQFDIIKNEYAVNTWTSTDRSKYKLILASKADSEVQFLLFWNTGLTDGGASVEDVKKSLNYAIEDVENVRHLSAAFKKEGVLKISVGVAQTREGYVADVLFYANPTSDGREKWIAIMRRAFKEWPLTPQTNILICFMEEDYFGKDFKEVLPNRFIHEWPGPKRDNCITTLENDWAVDLADAKILARFSVNSGSQRALNEYLPHAIQLASVWAKTNIKNPIYLREHDSSCDSNAHDLMAINYCIPYFLTAEAATAEPAYDEKVAGYICGTYQVDQKTFTHIKIKKEL